RAIPGPTIRSPPQRRAAPSRARAREFSVGFSTCAFHQIERPLREKPRDRCCLSCPLPLRERASRWPARVRMGEGASATPHPLFALVYSSCPLPQGERAL